jgi:purine-binding chemotaxis protein CheW
VIPSSTRRALNSSAERGRSLSNSAGRGVGSRSGGNLSNASTSKGCASLLCRVGDGVWAIPIEHVVETMRPLPVEPLPDAQDFVRGLSIVRGAALPVVDAARLLDGGRANRGPAEDEPGPRRFVTLRAGGRSVVLAVDGVVGVRTIDDSLVGDRPPLLGGASAEVVAKLGALDAQLLSVLRTVTRVPA